MASTDLYTPTLAHPSPASLASPKRGTGSPQGAVYGNIGDFYWDTTGDVLWFNETGGLSGWVISGGGGSVLSGAVNPSAAPTTTSALYYNTVTGVLFQWNGSAWV